jgi:ATP-dependent RNA helicase RhlB
MPGDDIFSPGHPANRIILSIISKLKTKIRNLTRPNKNQQLPPAGVTTLLSPETEPVQAQSSLPKKSARPPRKRSRRRKPNPKEVDSQIHGGAAAKRLETPAWDPAQFDVPLADGKMRFQDLDLPPEVMHAIADLNFQYCTPIQAEIMPSALAGKDATGRAQTGTGKTAAFLITIFDRFLRQPLEEKRRPGTPRVLILAPTRELVLQIADEARALGVYCQATVVTIFGGMDYEKQRRQLTSGTVDMIVATPGRLLDFHRHKDLDLSQVEILVIDEADRMLDMGFIPDVRRIVYCTPPKAKRQTMLFSATLTPEVTRLTSSWTKDPVIIEIEPEQVEVDSVDQVTYIVTNEDKFALLYNLITRQNLQRVMVFCNRKDETRRLTDRLVRYGLNCAIISGDIPQKKRIRTLDDFKAGRIRILVATDVAGRGIHVEDISHVVNYTLPQDPEDYVHRIGRTGRAGATGISVSFASEDDSFQLPGIEKFIGHPLSCIHPPDTWLEMPKPPAPRPIKTGEKPPANRPPRRRRPRKPRSSRPRKPASSSHG